MISTTIVLSPAVQVRLRHPDRETRLTCGQVELRAVDELTGMSVSLVFGLEGVRQALQLSRALVEVVDGVMEWDEAMRDAPTPPAPAPAPDPVIDDPNDVVF